jgi:hypothetical protein
MQEQRPLNSDGTLRRERARTRGQTFRVSLGVRDCVELERAAAERKLAPEALLSAIGRVVVRDGLINAGLDDLPSDAVRSS